MRFLQENIVVLSQNYFAFLISFIALYIVYM